MPRDPARVLASSLALSAALAFVQAVAPPNATGQFLLRGDLSPAQVETIDAASRAHFDRAEQFLAQKQWDEAVQAFRRGLEGESQRVEALPNSFLGDDAQFTTFVPARYAAQFRLLNWKHRAPAVWERYRRLIEAVANQWLSEGKAQRDPALLRRVVDQAYSSSATEEALRLLGEMAISHGQFHAARSYFEQLHPALTTTAEAAKELKVPAGVSWWYVFRRQSLDELWPRFEPWLRGGSTTDAPPERLAIVDPQAPLADAWARLVVVSILEGASDRARLELDILRRLAPEAEGQLAGRAGVWVTLLETLLTESADWPRPPTSFNWPTFAGNDSRNRQASAPPRPVTLGLRPAWSYPLPKLKSDKELLAVGRERLGEEAAAVLSYHPNVSGNTVLLRTDAISKSFVTALDLATGKMQWRVDYARSAGPEAVNRGVEESEGTEVSDAHAGLNRHLGVARYTGHITEESAYFRLGSPVVLPAQRKLNRILPKDQGYLLGLDLRSQGKPLERFPLLPEGPAWGFEGTPLVSRGELYVMLSRREGTHADSYVACYEIGGGAGAEAGNDETGRRTDKFKWRTRLASSESLGGGEMDELTFSLLALREDTLYANTNRGVVAAIDRLTGDLRWMTRYPRSSFDASNPEDDDETFQRDLNPCLLYRDLCIVAPADCRQVFALQAATGRLVWELPPGVAADAMHLLGVTGDYLILSGEYLYYVDVWTGRVVTQFPAPLLRGPDKPPPEPHGYGRGLVTESHIYWPTKEQLFIFENRVLPRRPFDEPKLAKVIDLTPRGLSGGNLLFAENMLLIAGPDRLYAVKAE